MYCIIEIIHSDRLGQEEMDTMLEIAVCEDERADRDRLRSMPIMIKYVWKNIWKIIERRKG